MQEAVSASTAFGSIRGFDAILESVDHSPGAVKQKTKMQAKKQRAVADKVAKKPASN